MVSMIHLLFLEGLLPEELTRTTMIIILYGRGVGGYSVIGLVEVIWKTITSIINTHIRVSVSLNDTLNRL